MFASSPGKKIMKRIVERYLKFIIRKLSHPKKGGRSKLGKKIE